MQTAKLCEVWCETFLNFPHTIGGTSLHLGASAAHRSTLVALAGCYNGVDDEASVAGRWLAPVLRGPAETHTARRIHISRRSIWNPGPRLLLACLLHFPAVTVSVLV